MGRDRNGHPTNYIKGSDPTRWITGVESYKEVVYHELWVGVSLRYFISQGGLKYELQLQKGADSSQIRFQYDCVDNLDIDTFSGDLVIETPFGQIYDEKPESYQVIQGHRSVVDSWFILIGEGVVSIGLDDYDPRYPLVVDPSVSFFTYLGGNSSDICEGVGIDSQGNVYVAGYTYSIDYPVTTGAITNVSAGWTDIFVSKLSSNGNVLEYSTYIGGDGFDNCYDMVVDDDGSVVICGRTTSSDFPVSTNSYNDTINGNEDAFVLKLASNGSEIIFSTFIGGSAGSDRGYAVEIDVLGYIYVAGMTLNDDFPVTGGTFDEDFNGMRDGFLFKMDPNGTSLIFSTYIGGKNDDVPSDMSLDVSNNIFLVGYTVSDDFPVTTGSYDTTHGDDEDIFVLKMNSTGNSIDYSTFLGQDNSDIGTGICLNDTGCAVIIGQSLSGSFPTTSAAYDTVLDGLSDIVVTKFDENGSSLVFSTFLGGTASEWGDSISIDKSGSIFISGTSSSDDFPTTMDAFDNSLNGRSDVVLVQIGVNGSSLDYSTYVGGGDIEIDSNLELGEGNEVLLAGQTYSHDFPVNIDVYDTEYNGTSSDMFVIRLDTTLADAVIPSAPTIVHAEEGNRSINVTWRLPASDGGLPIMGYKVYRGFSDSILSHVGSTTRSNLSFNDSILKAGTKYYYAISASNSVGEGPLTIVVNATPIGQPTSPVNFRTTAGCGTVLIEWSLPDDEGDLPLEGFIIYGGETSTALKEITDTPFPSREWLDTGLVNGRTYYYSICAYNNRGIGSLSPVIFATPVGPPGQPIRFEGNPGNGRIFLNWSRPSDDGGLHEMLFRLYWGTAEDDLRLRGDNITSLGYVDDGLSNGVVHYYSLRAINSAGAGPFSPIINVTPVGPPSSPFDLVLKAGNRSIELIWNVPGDDGGSRITSYAIRRAVNDTIFIELARVGDTNVFIDVRVQNGINYSYHVVAYNMIGGSSPSEERWAIPMGPPSEPTYIAIWMERDAIILEWSSPADWGGATTLQYEVLRGTTALSLNVVSSGISHQSYRDVNVSINTTYYFSIRALNIAGTGPLSVIRSIMILKAPGSCQDIIVTAGNAYVKLEWSPPSNDGGSPIIGYIIYRGVFETGPTELDNTGLNTFYNDSSVENGVTYYYTVIARNAIGRGNFSQVFNATPRGPPSSPIFVLIEVRDGKVFMNWIQPVGGDARVSGYILNKRVSSATGSQLISIDGQVKEYLDEDVEPGKTYYYHLSAVNEYGTSQASEIMKVHVDDEKGGMDTLGWYSLSIIIALFAIAVLFLYRKRGRNR